MIWSIIEALNVNLVGFQFEGHSPTRASGENVASAFGGLGAASFDVDSMPALPWKYAGINHSRLQDNSYSCQRTHGLHLDLPEKFGSKGQLYYHVKKT